MLKASTTWFTTYYLYYKDKLIGNSTRTFVYAANFLYFLYDWNNFSAAFFFSYNGDTYITIPSLVTKKEKLPKTFLCLVSRPLQPLSLLSSMLSKMRPAIFRYSLMSQCLKMLKCAAMSKWQLSLILATKIIKKDCKYLTLTQQLSETLYNFCPTQTIAQKVKSLQDNIAIVNKRL